MDTNPYRSPENVGESAVWQGRPWKNKLLGILAAAGGILLLGALLLPAKRGARETARSNTCRNNLRNVAIALNYYSDIHGALPPAYTVDADGRPLHSWRTLILPYLEQQSLYDQIDLSKPWDDPANKAAFETGVEVYSCPSGSLPLGSTTFLANVAPDGCFLPTEPRKLTEITDSHAMTLMVIEVDVAQAVHWMSPMDADETVIAKLSAPALMPHGHGINAAAVDGHVFPLSADAGSAQFRALISANGNDDAMLSQTLE
jgi:prepilin-type processing-associated H-X9-DG protein